jgi:hypothetical protein
VSETVQLALRGQNESTIAMGGGSSTRISAYTFETDNIGILDANMEGLEWIGTSLSTLLQAAIH